MQFIIEGEGTFNFHSSSFPYQVPFAKLLYIDIINRLLALFVFFKFSTYIALYYVVSESCTGDCVFDLT